MCRLTHDQFNLYKELLRSEEMRGVLRDSRGNGKAFTAIMALRKICNHPDLYAGAPEDGRPGKT